MAAPTLQVVRLQAQDHDAPPLAVCQVQPLPALIDDDAVDHRHGPRRGTALRVELAVAREPHDAAVAVAIGHDKGAVAQECRLGMVATTRSVPRQTSKSRYPSASLHQAVPRVAAFGGKAQPAPHVPAVPPHPRSRVLTCVGLHSLSLPPPGSSLVPTSMSSWPSGANLSTWCRPTSATQTLPALSTRSMWGM